MIWFVSILFWHVHMFVDREDLIYCRQNLNVSVVGMVVVVSRAAKSGCTGVESGRRSGAKQEDIVWKRAYGSTW